MTCRCGGRRPSAAPRPGTRTRIVQHQARSRPSGSSATAPARTASGGPGCASSSPSGPSNAARPASRTPNAGDTDTEEKIRAGIAGEQLVATELGRALDDDWTLLRGYRNRRGEIDHLLLGPKGLFAIEVKNINATVSIDGDRWRADKYDNYGNLVEQREVADRTGRSPSEQLNEPAGELERFLHERGQRVTVQRVVVLTHRRSRVGPRRHPTVHVGTSTDYVLSLVNEAKGTLDERQRADRRAPDPPRPRLQRAPAPVAWGTVTNGHPLRLYNSLGRRVEDFVPSGDVTGMYSCGPTVYAYQHLGNMRAYVFADTVRRALRWKGVRVRHVVNITDVGHAVSDADTGEDKMEVAAARERRSVLEIAEFYTRVFFEDLAALNVLPAAEYPRASAYVPQMIEFAATLEQRGYTYRLPSGLYFDTAKDPRYGELAQLHAEGQREAARVEHVAGRRSKTDFALWRTEEPGRRRVLRWDSPWGWGTPGWHLECSVMSIALLGPHFDIHTGGIDHRELHHVNEIAQSEAFLADGLPWVRYWLHNEFLQLGGAKMAKSAGGAPRLADLTEAGYHPAAFRLFLLGGHYRSQLDFTTAAIDAAQATLRRLAARIQPLRPLPAIETLDATQHGRPSRRPRPGPHRRRHLGRLQHPEAPRRVPGRVARPRDHPRRPAHRNRRRRRAARPGPGHPRPGRPGRPPRPRRPHRRRTAGHRAAGRRPHPGPQGTRLGPRRPDPRRTRRPRRPGHRHPRRPRLAAPLAHSGAGSPMLVVSQ